MTTEHESASQPDGIHSCSYFCNRPACVLAQRNELRDIILDSAPMPALAAPLAAPPAPAERRRDDAIAQAVKTCIEFGFYGVEPPPSGHWLNEMWDFGRKLATEEPKEAGALTDAETRGSFLAMNDATFLRTMAASSELRPGVRSRLLGIATLLAKSGAGEARDAARTITERELSFALNYHSDDTRIDDADWKIARRYFEVIERNRGLHPSLGGPDPSGAAMTPERPE